MNRNISKGLFIFLTKIAKPLYDVNSLKEGMFLFSSKIGKDTYLINEKTKKGYMLINTKNYVQVSEDEIDLKNVQEIFKKERIEDDPRNCIKQNLYFYFYISEYKDGVAEWTWEIYPDGRYFEEEDGTGMKPNNAVIISTTISSEVKIITPFKVNETKW